MVANVPMDPDTAPPICLTKLGMGGDLLGEDDRFLFFTCTLLGTIASLRALFVYSKH